MNNTVKQRHKMINPAGGLSKRKQCELLSINRSSLYFKPIGESELNLDLMSHIDKIHLKYPTYGVLRMQDQLLEQGIEINHKRVRRLMRKMNINAIYPKPNLSRLGRAKYIYPYLLRGLDIERPNQVWAIDISYIPMKRGFMYLTAVIDLYSRYIVGWQLSNSLDKEGQTELIEQLFRRHGTPEVLNSDQGSQYTTSNWVECLKSHKVRISMDGRGRALDNIYIERFWRTIKYDYIYLNPAESGLELYQGIDEFIKGYNQRRHQGINREKPIDRYKNNPKNKLKSA